ncbi:glycoside hydrolase family 65 protein [Candidatus Nitronereus thalassa]|uniref:Glycosyl hydrolase family 65 protein n=1 Tax=Candidatus Nitronereus thalassa TaxID=3020898 RepID=A0ABU3K9B6_9BACT|nr:glycosyl hydrolase family 65 protein [Candidatus Nitronereus thalassa]MDT7042883.1 glycosyl hydrolase family 65 protein [Candidatus Nitronereus thalassa]
MSDWSLVYEEFNPEQERLREALCTLGNGYFATRGAAHEAEADSTHYPGTYLAGGYNRLHTEIGGRTIEHEDLVNLPNWLSLSFRHPDANWFNLQAVDILSYRQELDLKAGVLHRAVQFQDSQLRRTTVSSRRFVHIGLHHLAGLEVVITPENWSGPLEVRSALDGRVVNAGVARYQALNNKHLAGIESSVVGEDEIFLYMETNQSKLRIAEAARTRFVLDDSLLHPTRAVIQEPELIGQACTIPMKQGRPLTIEKIVTLYTARDHGISECGLDARQALTNAAGFEDLLRSHTQHLSRLWQRCDIGIQDGEDSQLTLRLHIFHLLQTTSPSTIGLDVGVPARGLHGEAYRGHIFWDELFIFPFLNLRIPDITKSLLLYRHRRLDQARRNAQEAGFNGALYPWQSGSNGREESQRLHLNPQSGRWTPDNSALQRHVNAAIVYNVWHYFQVTDDWEFLSFYGAEMILEIARFWASAVSYNAEKDRYEIFDVMGPDEYHDQYPKADHPGLNNNAYTNLMVVWVFCRALELLDMLSVDSRTELREIMHISTTEAELWDDISRKMFLPFHDKGIISQFEGYEDLEEFDWERYREKYGDIHRLDRILEAEGDSTNRYKLSKQADVLMLFYLFSSDELRILFKRLGYPFKYSTIPQNVAYYLSRTAHGSSLSRVVHSWVTARSDRAQAWDLLKAALRVDISDVQSGTTAEGIHLGAMAGTVDLIQRGHTGLETRGGTLYFNPCLPKGLKALNLRLFYRGHSLDVAVTQETFQIGSRPGRSSPIRISIKGKSQKLKPGQIVSASI